MKKKALFLIVTLILNCRKNNPPEPFAPVPLTDKIQVAKEALFEVYVSDPDGDMVCARVSWGDGSISDWSSYFASDTHITFSHIYKDTGIFYLRAQAKDIYGKESAWSDSTKIRVQPNTSPYPPDKPVSSDSVYAVGSFVTFSTYVSDPDRDSVCVRFDWGDGDTSLWSSFYPSGSLISMSHKYEIAGEFEVRAQAKDPAGEMSEWSDPCEILIEYPPEKPMKPILPSKAKVNEIVEIKSSAEDPENNFVKLLFDFGDGHSVWSNWVESGDTVSVLHSFSKSGVYYVKVKAKDHYGLEGEWSQSASILIEVNYAPEMPQKPVGPDTAQINVEVTFWTTTVDPNGDSISIRFSWGDGNTSNWSKWIASGDTVYMSHIYTSSGSFMIQAQAKDKYGASSDWSDPAEIVIISKYQ